MGACVFVYVFYHVYLYICNTLIRVYMYDDMARRS